MRVNKVLASAVASISLLWMTGCAVATGKASHEEGSRPIPNHVITMDQTYLEYAKKRVADNDPVLKPAFEKLVNDAKAALLVKPESVTYKKITPPSGSKSDYMSLAPYWWPDPSKPDGLPYLQKDGQFNPSSKNGDTDSVRMQQMCMSAQTLSLAYFFTGDLKYAHKAGEVIRTWFLNPQTRMNPNLNFGQAVMGRVNGRGIGLIDTRNLWMVIDAALLVAPAGGLSSTEMAQLRQWFQNFSQWMQTSDVGLEEFAQHNNHGTFYDMQVANYALFVGDMDLARRTVARAKELRIRSQIAIDGKQHAELERTTPFHYVAFNLDAMENIARYGEQVGDDVWKFNEKKRGLRNGINFMAQYAAKPETWPYKELREMETELALPVLLKAERAYPGAGYAKIAAQLPERRLEAQEYIALYSAIRQPFPTTRNSIDLLIWPVIDKQ